MLDDTNRQKWPLRSLAAIGAIALVGCVVMAWVSAGAALEERRSATAATDLRLAVLTVASTQSIAGANAPEVDRLADAVATLKLDPSLALHSLDGATAAEVERSLGVVVEHGTMLLAGVEHIGSHGLMDHEATQAALREATVQSNADAAAGEHNAQISMLGAAIALLLGCYAVVALRWTANREAARREGVVQAAQRLEAVLNETPDAKLIVTDDGRITYYSSNVLDIINQETPPTHFDDLLKDADAETKEQLRVHVLSADARTAPLTLPVSRLTGDSSQDLTLEFWVSDLRSDALVAGRLVTARDVTKEARLNRALERRALQDALTGLPNRWALTTRMEQDLSRAALLMIDLDGFKQTNDVLGHGAGDQLLTIVARRFGHALPSGCELFRLGGDEFAVVIADSDEPKATTVASALLGTLEEAARLDQGFENVRASVGIAIGSPTSANATELLRHADIALYAAKAAGGGQSRVFELEMEHAALIRRDLTQALETANIHDEYRLMYQPIVQSESGRVTHLEALLRWTSPRVGIVPPDVFIPLAESSGRIVSIGRYVIETACEQLAAWRDVGVATEIGVTLNISPRQLDETGFVSEFLGIIERHGLRPKDVTVEVTESVLFREEELGLEQLRELQEHGCHIAVDDFGSGYSNLGRLLHMPLDTIKIDRSLLVKLDELSSASDGSRDQCRQVMTSIVSIGESIGAGVVAEGVETDAQWQALQHYGVPSLQGYLFSRPVEADQVADLLAQKANLLGASASA